VLIALQQACQTKRQQFPLFGAGRKMSKDMHLGTVDAWDVAAVYVSYSFGGPFRLRQSVEGLDLSETIWKA